jgi:hypothetical protein
MKKKPSTSWIIFLSLFQCLLLGCQNSDDDIYDEEFVINDAVFQNYSEDYKFNDTNVIPANSYKIAINLSTKNSYADKFGINPVQQNKIESITIKTLNDIKNFAKKGDNINRFFLVQKGYRLDLYQTIESFLKKDNGRFDSLDNGKLVFTNLDNVLEKNNTIIGKKDSLYFEFDVRLTFDDKLEVSDILSVTLFSN